MIHFDIESLIEKIDNSNNDLEKSSTTQKKNKKKKKQQKIFFVVIQCQLFGHFIIQKIGIVYFTMLHEKVQ